MSDLVNRLRTYDGWQASPVEESTLCNEAASRIEELETRCEERMGEILRAKEIIERLTGQRERLYGALNNMVANESMVERAHLESGNPYFNAALEKARAALNEGEVE